LLHPPTPVNRSVCQPMAMWHTTCGAC
jgi:hypothetical protein